MAHPFFPIFIDLHGRRVVVVGAGRIAARRVNTLLAFGPDIAVVAPEACPEIAALAAAGRVALHRRAYAETDLDGADLALAATDDGELNAEIAAACGRRGIPVNVSSDRTLCDFLFPGVAVKGDVVAGVTASGSDHRLAKALTGRIREIIEG